MSYAGFDFMGTESHETRPSERLALYLRGQYRKDHRIKKLAQDLVSEGVTCTQKTAENILGGHWPSDLHFAAIVRRFGRDVLDAVFGADIDETVARLTAEARALEQQLQDIQARARQAKGYQPQPDLFDDAPAPLDRADTLQRLNDTRRP